MFLELNSTGLYQTSGKEKESCCLVFPSLTKSKLRHFHFVVLQRWQRNLQKKRAEFLFCESKPTAFLLFSLLSLSSLLKLPNFLKWVIPENIHTIPRAVSWNSEEEGGFLGLEFQRCGGG